MEDEVTIKIESRKSEIRLTKTSVELHSYYNFLLNEIRDLEVENEEQYQYKVEAYDGILDIIGHMLLVAGDE